LRGAGAQVSATDAVTTSALRDLQRNVDEAQAMAGDEAVAGNRAQADPNAEMLAELQNLRRQLNDLNRKGQGQGGDQVVQQQLDRGAAGQGESAQQGQRGQAGQGQQTANGQGQQQANAAGGAQQGGQFGNRDGGFGPGGSGSFYDPRRGGVWDPRNRGLWDNPQAVNEAREQLQDLSRELLTRTTELRNQGLSDEELQAVRQLGDALRGSVSGNPALIAEELQALVNLTEQLELRMAAAGNGAERAAVRAQAPTQVAPEFEDAVAEYYRRLSRSEQ
jgi:hypothetical protein